MYRIDKPAGSHPGFPHGIQVAALSELLGDKEIELVCRHLGHTWRDRIFTPGVTVRSMVHRALNPDKSIRAVLTDLAVADDRIQRTPADASWCEARARLPQKVWAQLLQHSVSRLKHLTAGQFLYQQRPVFLIDGSTAAVGPPSSSTSIRPTRSSAPVRRDHEDHCLHRGPSAGPHPQDPRTLRTLARPAAPRTAPVLVAIPAGSVEPRFGPGNHPRGRSRLPGTPPSRGTRPARTALGAMNPCGTCRFRSCNGRDQGV